MKKQILTFLASATLFLGVMGFVANANAIVDIYQGGTGRASTTQGDLLVGTSSLQSFGVLHVGTNGYVLTASSSAPTGLAWTQVSGGSGTVGPSTSTYVAVFNASGTITGYASLSYNSTTQRLSDANGDLLELDGGDSVLEDAGGDFVALANGVQIDAAGGTPNLQLDSNGQLILQPRTSSGTVINDTASNNNASLDTSLLTGNQNYQFPNASGIFCLTTTCLTSSAATTTINGTQAALFYLIGDGTTITSTVSGATTTFKLINTGNWAGTWQGVNSTTFYLASNPSGYITTSTNNFGGVTSTITIATSTASGIFNVTSSGNKIFTLTIPSNVGFFMNDKGYLTSGVATNTIIAGGTATGPAITIATSGPLLAVNCTGSTCTFTSLPTSTILLGYATSSAAGTGTCTNCNITVNGNGIVTSIANGSAGGGGATTTINQVIGPSFTFNVSSTTSTIPSVTTSTSNINLFFPNTKHIQSWTVGTVAQGVDFTSIQSALNACGTAGGGTIYVLGGTYAQGGTGLQWKGSNCAVWGDFGSSTITFTGATTLFATASSGAMYGHDELHNFIITGDGNTGGTAVDMSNMSHNIYSNLIVDNIGTVFKLHDTVDITFYNTVEDIDATTIGKFGIDGSSTEPWNGNTFDNMFIGCATANCVGVLEGNSEHNTFSNLRIEPAGAPLTGSIGIEIYDANVGSNPGTFGNVYINPYIEGNAIAINVSSSVSGGQGVDDNEFIGGISDTNGTINAPASTQTQFIGFNNNFSQYNVFASTTFTGPITAQDNTSLSQTAATFENNTSFAHTGGTPLVSMKLLNGTDSDNDLNLNNAGTGNALNIAQGRIGFATSSVSVSSCGSGSPTVSGSNSVGAVTIGTGGITSCKVTFATPTYKLPPVCIVSDSSSTDSTEVTAVSSSSVTIGFNLTLAAGTAYYHCFGNPN